MEDCKGSSKCYRIELDSTTRDMLIKENIRKRRIKRWI